MRSCISGLKKFYQWQDAQQDNFYPLHANLCLMRLPHRDQENNLTVKLAAKYSSQ